MDERSGARGSSRTLEVEQLCAAGRRVCRVRVAEQGQRLVHLSLEREGDQVKEGEWEKERERERTKLL